MGSGCRYGLALLINEWLNHPRFPAGTFLINLLGSFAIGLLAELFRLQVLLAPELRLALITGVLGGFTTFSAYSLENLSLLREGANWLAASYALGSVAGGLLCALAGMRLAQVI